MKSPQNLKLVHLSLLIPSAHLSDVLVFVEARRAFNVEVRAFQPQGQPQGNGATADDDGDGGTIGIGTIGKSKAQQEWLAKNVRGEITIKELQPRWTAAGFRESSIYGAIKRATRHKMIRKVKPGVYRSAAKG